MIKIQQIHSMVYNKESLVRLTFKLFFCSSKLNIILNKNAQQYLHFINVSYNSKFPNNMHFKIL